MTDGWGQFLVPNAPTGGGPKKGRKKQTSDELPNQLSMAQEVYGNPPISCELKHRLRWNQIEAFDLMTTLGSYDTYICLILSQLFYT